MDQTHSSRTQFELNQRERESLNGSDENKTNGTNKRRLSGGKHSSNDRSDPFFVKLPGAPGNSKDRKEKVTQKIESGSKEKRPFDKKKWRLQKYSKKYKMQQWEEKRKRVVLQEYHRDLRGIQEAKFDVQKIYQEEEVQNTDDTVEEKKTKRAPKKAHLEFEKIKEEKQRKKDELIKKKAERDVALKQAKKMKAEKQRRLGKKTRKGQPVMKERLEMLLQQIQKSLD